MIGLKDEWEKRKEKLEELDMLDEVLILIRDCYVYMMDIRFIREDVYFEKLKDHMVRNKFWLREGIGEDLLEEILCELGIDVYSENSRNKKIETMILYGGKIKEIKEKFTKENNKLYH